MPSAPSIDPDSIADALLVHARDPAARMLRGIDPSSGFDLCARLALGKPVALRREDLRRAAADGALRAAALRFIARTQFAPDADHYTLLGLAPNAPPQAIRDRHRVLMQIVHPDRTPRDVRWPEGLAARVNRAYGTLKDPERRAAYDRERRLPPLAYVAYAAHAGRPATAAAIGRRVPPQLDPHMPEWLTYGVGGFVRRNPAAVIFALLISVCSVAIATVAFVDQGARLHRDRGRDTVAVPAASTSRVAPATAAAFGPPARAPAVAAGTTPTALMPAAAPSVSAPLSTPAPVPPTSPLSSAPSSRPAVLSPPLSAPPSSLSSRSLSSPPLSPPSLLSQP